MRFKCNDFLPFYLVEHSCLNSTPQEFTDRMVYFAQENA